MIEKECSITGQKATWYDFGGEGELAHFYHANGFPLGGYTPFLNELKKNFKLCSLKIRATWPEVGSPKRSMNWFTYADDLIHFLESEVRKPVIGIGHSMGASATVYAAEKRPDLFRALILIEPAMVSRQLSTAAKYIPYFLKRRFEPGKSTFQKQDQWPSREAYLKAFREVRAFKRLGEETIAAFGKYGVEENSSGRVQLAFSKDWEAHNYTCPGHIAVDLERLKIPVIALRGKPSLFLSEKLWAECQDKTKQGIFHQINEYGHLLPLEAPELCASTVARLFKDIQLR